MKIIPAVKPSRLKIFYLSNFDLIFSVCYSPRTLNMRSEKRKFCLGPEAPFFGADRFDRLVFTGVCVANFFSSSNFDPILFAQHTYTACLSVCRSVCLSVFVCLSFCVCLSVCLSVCTVGMSSMFEHSSFCTSVCLSDCQDRDQRELTGVGKVPNVVSCL